jgi:hypothetical protein
VRGRRLRLCLCAIFLILFPHSYSMFDNLIYFVLRACKRKELVEVNAINLYIVLISWVKSFAHFQCYSGNANQLMRRNPHLGYIEPQNNETRIANTIIRVRMLRICSPWELGEYFTTVREKKIRTSALPDSLIETLSRSQTSTRRHRRCEEGLTTPDPCHTREH